MLKQNKMWCWRAWVYSARNLHFLNSSKRVSTPKIRPKYWNFTSSLHLLLLATSFQAPRKCCETYSLGNTISPKLWSEEWLCFMSFLWSYTLPFKPLHHLVSSSSTHTSWPGISCIFREIQFLSPFYKLFVCLIISLQVGNILRKQLCSTRTDRYANRSVSFVAYK